MKLFIYLRKWPNSDNTWASEHKEKILADMDREESLASGLACSNVVEVDFGNFESRQ